MKVNTAAAFILSGISLWFLIDERAKRWKIYFAQVCAFIVALIGGLSLAQYLFGINIGIDQLLFTEPVGAIETSHAGRMAPATAFNFLFVGISLLLYSRKVFTTARVLISVVAIVGLLSFLGYVFGLSSLLHLGPFTIMAIHTSITFILITISLLSMRFIFNSEFIIRSGFWIAVVILSYIGIISYWNIIRQIEDAKSLTHSHEVIQKLEGIFSNVKDVETGVRGFVITGKEEYLEPYYAQYNSIETELKELRILTFDNLNHQRSIVLLEPIVKDKIAYMSETITIRRTDGLSATVTEQYQTPKGKQLMDEIRVLIEDMKDEENKFLQEREKKSETSSRNAMVTLVVGNIVSFILLVAIFILLIRENRVRKQAELVSKQAEEEVRKLNADLARRIDKRTAELRKAYEEIQKNEERLRQTLDNMLEGIQIIGKDWRYRYLNDAAAKHGRKSMEELIGYKMMEVYPGIENTEMFAVLRRCMDERIPQRIENEFTYPDNTKRCFDLSIQPTPEGIFILSIDITESKKAEEQRAELVGRMTRIASHVPGVIYQYCLRPDGSSYFPYASEGIRDIYGVAPDEVKEDATPVFNVLHPDDIERISKSIKKSAETLTKGYDVYRVNLPSGKTIWVEGNSSPQKQEDGSILWYGYIKDITERKHAEEVQRKNEEQYRLISENVADMIAVLDLEGKRIYNNPAYKPILGDPKLLQGTDSFQEIHPDDREKIKRIFKETVQTGIGQRAEYRFVAKDGSIHFIESQGSVIRDEKGDVSNVVVVSRDITEKKLLEQQLLRSQRMESIGTLAGGIAHDLNNVLAPIMLAIEILRKKHTDPDSERMLDTMGTSAKRGSDIVKQVLAFGRGVEGERLLLQPKHVVDEIVKIAQETFPKDIRLRKDVPKNLWVINADPTQMHQVLLNTFVNARDAMPSGGTITISAENIRLDENYARMHIKAKPDNYVL
ncbi:MAG: PAS domain S-box protein, partial [Ignavibacteriales bacterium]|nr:PAS domain S-box protein [Ignavibacteriales bacterium]